MLKQMKYCIWMLRICYEVLKVVLYKNSNAAGRGYPEHLAYIYVLIIKNHDSFA